jgi:hypothetical protein
MFITMWLLDRVCDKEPLAIPTTKEEVAKEASINRAATSSILVEKQDPLGTEIPAQKFPQISSTRR